MYIYAKFPFLPAVAILITRVWAGQPRRHLLTTGWSAFVNKKKLVSGDAVLFLRYKNFSLFIVYLYLDKPLFNMVSVAGVKMVN